MVQIERNRAAVWRARRYSAGYGRVWAADRHWIGKYWRVVVKQESHHWEMWYPGNADGLARAERQLRLAEALR